MPSTEVQKLRSFVTFALDKLDAKDADLHDGSPEEDFQELVCRPTDPNLNPDPNPNPNPNPNPIPNQATSCPPRPTSALACRTVFQP